MSSWEGEKPAKRKEKGHRGGPESQSSPEIPWPGAKDEQMEDPAPAAPLCSTWQGAAAAPH